jgi:hypothetical protein
LKKKKIYRDKNKIKIKNYNQQYYNQNKNKILQDAKKKVKCKYCQKLIQKNYYQKHIENYCKVVTIFVQFLTHVPGFFLTEPSI